MTCPLPPRSADGAVHEAVLSEVTVSDLTVSADIGVFAHEIGAPQTLVIQVRLTLSPPAGDRLDQTVDYNLVADRAEKLGRERIGLIETFARRLAEACLAHEGVSRAEVAVAKPGALRNATAGARIVLARA